MQILSNIRQYIARQPRYIAWLIKAFIAGFFVFLVWYEIFKRENFDDISRLFLQQMNGENAIWLWLTLAILPFNWAAETQKWLVLMRKSEKVSFWRGYIAVLSGVVTSLFMPNRMGDFGGRILYLKPKNALKVVISTVVANFGQMNVIMVAGFLGFTYFLYNIWNIEPILRHFLFIFCLSFNIIIIFIFLHLEIVVPIFKKIKFLYRFPRIIKDVNTVRKYTRAELLRSLSWGVLRYFIYMLQYYTMLKFFGIEPPFFQALACIATIYYLQMSIPLPPVVGLVARSEVALQIWGMFDANPLSILATTFSLWVINLLIPAFLGLIFIFNTNISKSLGYADNTDFHEKN